MKPKICITLLTLVFLNADIASARYTLGDAVDAASRKRDEFDSRTEEVDADASAQNTLEEAVEAASNRKPLGIESKTKDSVIQGVADGMGENVSSSNQPQTLGEAVAATESKRMDVNAVGLRVDIVDRYRPTLINEKESLSNQPQTLGEAVAATESKRMDVNVGGLRGKIVDRERPTLVNQENLAATTTGMIYSFGSS